MIRDISRMKVGELAAELRPYFLDLISGAGASGGPFAPTPHDLSSSHHSGSIADSQAPQFLMTDGTRSLTGNLTVGALVTIDGVDISVLKTDHDTFQSAYTSHLTADSHTQYLNNARHDVTARHTLGTVVPHDDHGLLSGLGDDDHSIYLLASGARDVSGTLLPAVSDAYDLGSSSRLWRSIYASELDTFLLKENAISVVGGMMYIGKGQGTLQADVTAGATQMDFGSAVSVNDFILFRGSGQLEAVKVTSLASGTTYNVTRNQDGSGANAWVAGSVWFNLGYNGTGRIEFDAVQTPRISIKRQGTVYTPPASEPIRIGDLNGWDTVGTERYGIGIGDFSGGNYLRYEPSGGMILKGGTGAVSLDSGGLYIRSQISYSSSEAIRFRDTGGTDVGLVYGNGYPGGSVRYLYLKGGNNNSVSGSVNLEGRGTINGYIYLDATGSGPTVARLLISSQGGARQIDTLTDEFNVLNRLSADYFRSYNYFDALESSAPATPPGGYSRWYADSNGFPIAKQDNGVYVPMCVGQLTIPILQGYFVGSSVVTVATNNKGVQFRDANTDIVYYNIAVPAGWGGRSATIDFWWSPSNANTGSIVVSCEARVVSHGVTMSASAYSGPAVTVPAPGITDRITKVSIGTYVMSTEDQAQTITFYRAGGSGGDTYSGSMNLLALSLRLL